MTEVTVSPKAQILIYTRAPIEGAYPTHLAFSAHFATSRDGRHFQALNRNYGMLFATSTIGADNTIHEKGLKKPWLFRAAGGKFGVIAIRVNADGSVDEESRGKLLLWASSDLSQFKEVGLIDLHCDINAAEATCEYDSCTGQYHISWQDYEGNGYRNTMADIFDTASVSTAQSAAYMCLATPVIGPEGTVNGNILEVGGNICDKLALRWMTLTNVAVQVPDPVIASSVTDMATMPATAVYSDGSTAAKRVQWDTDAIDFSKPGAYKLSGTVIQEDYPFPLARGYADPDVMHWNGKYYFIATNDNADQVGLFVRESESLTGLFAENAKEYLILDKDESQDITRCFWAPEFHNIGGSLYILCALAGEETGPQCYMMKLKQNGSIIDPSSWEAPIRVQTADGAFLAQDGITLDMTYFKAAGGSYLVWSYRRHFGTARDTGSMLYIATIDEAMPWKLKSEPALLSRPLYGWENVDHTINNEGPYAIVTEDTVYLTYSGGAAGGYTYALGLLTARIGDDLLNPGHWTKSCAPVLSFYSVENEFGAGHNSFFKDQYGNLMIVYHAQESLNGKIRCTGIRRVHFNIHKEPVFDMSANQDIDPRLARVCSTVLVR